MPITNEKPEKLSHAPCQSAWMQLCVPAPKACFLLMQTLGGNRDSSVRSLPPTSGAWILRRAKLSLCGHTGSIAKWSALSLCLAVCHTNEYSSGERENKTKSCIRYLFIFSTWELLMLNNCHVNTRKKTKIQWLDEIRIEISKYVHVYLHDELSICLNVCFQFFKFLTSRENLPSQQSRRHHNILLVA